METVSFVNMADGTKEDYDLLGRNQEVYNAALPDRLMQALEGLRESFSGYQVSRYEHSLQSATRALRDGRDTEYVVAALLHDLGDELAPHTHGEMVGAILRPFVRPELVWIVKHHGVFQLVYYGHHTGADPLDARAVLETYLGGTPDQMPERYRDASPIFHVSATAPPSLLIYGTRDHIVEARFGRDLHRRLQAAGASSVLLEIPWAEHAFDLIPGGLSGQLSLAYVEQFLAQTLR